MEQEYNPIEWIEGNKISLALPLQKVEITPQGKIVTDYIPDGVVEVVLKSKYKTYRYQPEMDENLCIFSDNGALRAGEYAVEIVSTEADGTKRRSQYPRVMLVHKDSTSLLEPFEDFPDYAEGAVLDTASVFYFAKGDKGDQGLSAYEVAVKNGYVGTEQEWLESLKGKDGTGIEDVYTREQSDERYVQKQDGKGLSANDYSDTDKEKLAGLENYDDTALREMIGGKQDTINDLDDIKRGAAAGATALQQESDPTVPSWAKQPTKPTYTAQEVGAYVKPTTGIPSTDLSSAVQTSLGKADTALQSETDPTVPSWAKQSSKPSYTAQEVGALPSNTPLFSGDYNDLTNKPTIPDVSGKADKSEMSVVDGTGANADKTTITLKSGTSATVLKSHQDISGKEDKVDIVSASGATLSAEVGKYYTLSNVGTLAITLPTIASGTTKVQTVTFYIAAGSSPAVTFTSTHTIIYPKDYTIEANGLYEISAAWNGIGWVIGLLTLEIPN